MQLVDAFIQRLVTLSGKALKFEDKILLDAVAKNKLVYSKENESGGILRFNNERYYQFVIARALVAEIEYRVEIEVDTHDLLLNHSSQKRFAVVEMKRWMSSTGESEIPAIRHDLHGKLPVADAELKVMMIFSANPRDQMSKQLEWLSPRLNDSPISWKTYCFPTKNLGGLDFEFWVAACQVQ
jgi:hypothetical protein